MKIIQRAAEAYPSDLGKEELAAEVGASATVIVVRQQPGPLRSFGLITYPTSGRVRAGAGLFPERKAT